VRQAVGLEPQLDREQLVRAAQGISASRQIAPVKGRVDAVLEEAAREKRDAAGLRDLSSLDPTLESSDLSRLRPRRSSSQAPAAAFT